MGHHAFLIIIFLIITLVLPAVIAMRVFGAAFSWYRTDTSADKEVEPESVQAQSAAEDEVRDGMK